METNNLMISKSQSAHQLKVDQLSPPATLITKDNVSSPVRVRV